MPTLEYFLICESLSVDQETNRISLFNVLEDFQIEPPAPNVGQSPQAPSGILSQCAAVALFNREPDDGDREFLASVRINTVGADQFAPEIRFRMERNRQRIVMRFVGMPPVGADGMLQFELLLDGEHQAYHKVILVSAA